MYDAILLPTDGSAGMASAIKHCFIQARQYDATVHALYVVDVRAYVMLPEETKGQVKQVLMNEGERTLRALTDHAETEGADLVPAVQEGIPHEAILQYVNEHDIQMIVMGTHGRSGETHRIVGSIAEEVVRKATIPVMTIRTNAEDIEAVRNVLLEDTRKEITDEQRRYIS